MANKRRMFSNVIIDSDAFSTLPLTAQALYFHLGLEADDEGFVNNATKIQRSIGASEDDLKMLIDKRFLLKFESGVVVIKHWFINNSLRHDRSKPTTYTEERESLIIKENGAYTENTGGKWLSNGCQVSPQYNKDNKDNKDKLNKLKYIADFCQAWELYPRKQGKQAAEKAYAKARKEGISHKTIIDGIERYKNYIEQSKTDAKYIKMGSTWFNQRCWDDDYTVKKKSRYDWIDEIGED